MEKIAKTITTRQEDYPRWYQDVIAAADLAENAPVRGSMIIKPNGYAIWENMQAELNQRIKALGVKNAYFPLFIPESFIKKEADHIEGFAPELAIVTHGGGEKLAEPLVVRPTSETIIYDSFSRWINSYRDLPFKINQWANIVRWEMRPRLFLRTTEFLWQEGHTAHATAEEARDYAMMILRDVYADFAREYLAMPTYIGTKSASERFAGAADTFGIEAVAQDGKFIQFGTTHDLGDHFSKVFNVRYQDESGQLKNTYITSWGVSTRMIGSLIMAHGDDKGIILPPKIAPTQIVIIPIGDDSTVAEAAKKLMMALSEKFRVELDNRSEMRPGEKFYDGEKKGVPLRIELGPKDLSSEQCIAVRRDDGHKVTVSLNDNPLKEIGLIIDDIQKNLYDIAKRRIDEQGRVVNSWEEFKTVIVNNQFAHAHWCGDPECEAAIKEETKATTRVLPFDSEVEGEESGCVKCGRPSPDRRRWIFAKSY